MASPTQNSANATQGQTALVIFAFNRHYAMVRLLRSLAACPEFSTLPLYIFIDGARHVRDISAVDAVAAVADQLVHPQKLVVRRPQNMGLRKSLRAGISQVLEQHPAAIILEDDLIIGPHGLDYFLRALAQYCDDKRVASICGYAFLDVEDSDDAPHTARFLPMTNPWGWATWQDRWQSHRASWGHPPNAAQITAGSFRTAMNVFGQRNYSHMLRAAEGGRVNSWWIYWHYDAIRCHQISLFPAKAHVVNAGLDGLGTHANRWNVLRGLFPNRTLVQAASKLPDVVEIDYSLLDKIVSSREARLHRLVSLLGAIRRKFMRHATS